MSDLRDRALRIIEQNVLPGESWKSTDLMKAISKVLPSETPQVERAPFHHRAWFIHGFYLAVVALLFTLMVVQKGTLAYDFFMKVKQ